MHPSKIAAHQEITEALLKGAGLFTLAANFLQLGVKPEPETVQEKLTIVLEPVIATVREGCNDEIANPPPGLPPLSPSQELNARLALDQAINETISRMAGVVLDQMRIIRENF